MRLEKGSVKFRIKLVTLISILLAVNTSLFAGGKFSLTGGWGNYNMVNVGTQWNFTERSSLSTFVGSSLGWNGNTGWATGLSFEQVFLKSIIHWKIKPGYSLGTIYWTQNDELYYFETFSFPAMVILAYPISSKISIHAEGGGIMNAVQTSDRKQNVEAGYPSRFNGAIRLSLIYKLGKK
jgi:hypothetical protein